jgi:hypothetical protein
MPRGPSARAVAPVRSRLPRARACHALSPRLVTLPVSRHPSNTRYPNAPPVRTAHPRYRQLCARPLPQPTHPRRPAPTCRAARMHSSAATAPARPRPHAPHHPTQHPAPCTVLKVDGGGRVFTSLRTSPHTAAPRQTHQPIQPSPACLCSASAPTALPALAPSQGPTRPPPPYLSPMPAYRRPRCAPGLARPSVAHPREPGTRSARAHARAPPRAPPRPRPGLPTPATRLAPV